MMKFLSVTTYLYLYMGCCALFAAEYKWPEVTPVQKEFRIDDVSQAYISFDINGKDGSVLYRLECTNPRVASLRNIDFDYSGDFECRLSSRHDYRYSTLLTYDPNYERDWMSRGRFLLDELYGRCADYPEFGRVRHFKLRGMAITLQLTKLDFGTRHPTEDDPRDRFLRGLHLRVLVNPDSTAKSTIAGEVPFAEPPSPDYDSPNPKQHCNQVRYKHLFGKVSQQFIKARGLDRPFPEIAQTSAILHLTDRPESVAVHDQSGKAAYRLDCEPIPNGLRDGLSDIACHLFQKGIKYDLLADSVDPYSLQNRARISLYQAVGECAKYPQWGATRTFALRGFRLVVKIVGFKQAAKDKYKEVEVAVQFIPDRTMVFPVAYLSHYIDPSFLPIERPGACAKILTEP